MNKKSRIKRILTADLLKNFKSNDISDDVINRIEVKLTELGNFTPVVGIFGKTGVGKSHLCNALFGKETAKVSDVDAGTREPQEVFVRLSEADAGIKLIDLPGVGENKVRDEEYSALYKEWIPKLDLVIWVIRADDRTFSVDEYFYDNIVKKQIKESNIPFLVVINQVDRINPLRDWDEGNQRPGFKQQKVIGERTQWAVNKFNISTMSIVEVSAYEKYNLGCLVETIIDAVPNEKKLGFYNSFEETVKTEGSEESTIKGVMNYLKEFFQEIKPYIPDIIRGINYLAKSLKG